MRQPPLDVLKHEPLPELAAALRTRCGNVVERWRELVTALIPGADEFTRKQIEDDTPQILDELAIALEAEEPRPTEVLIKHAPNHGQVRFQQSFNFNELLLEYQVLRRVVIEELTDELRRPLSKNEVVAVNGAIDIAMRMGAVEFAQHQEALITADANTMSKYLSHLSHDLRGNLNGALLMLEVLRRDLLKDPKYSANVEDLDTMRRSMLDTVSTMDRFLHAERLRRGKMPVRATKLDLRELLKGVVRNVQYQIGSSSPPITVDVADPGEVHTDRDVLVIVLQNLVSNAIKYGNNKPVLIDARPHGPGGTRISVTDQGPGVKPEMIDQLFEAFTRGETYGKKGAGLGLSIVKQAAELLGAKISVESEPGRGATFHLDLPPQPAS